MNVFVTIYIGIAKENGLLVASRRPGLHALPRRLVLKSLKLNEIRKVCITAGTCLNDHASLYNRTDSLDRRQLRVAVLPMFHGSTPTPFSSMHCTCSY